jgi:hypothetical protein
VPSKPSRHHWIVLLAAPPLVWAVFVAGQYLWVFLRVNNSLAVVAGTPDATGIYLYRWGSLYRLTPQTISPLSMAWSPDANTIAFTFRGSAPDTGIHIGILDIGSRQYRTVHSLDCGDDHRCGWPTLAWSPDGRVIVFTARDSPGGAFDLYLLDVQTQTVSTLPVSIGGTEEQSVGTISIRWTPGPFPLASACFHDQRNISHCYVYGLSARLSDVVFLFEGANAQWLEDGDTIVYDCFDQVAWGPTRLCAYSVEASTLRLITEGTDSLDWSTDGRFSIGFDGGGEGEATYIAIYNAVLDKVYRFKAPTWPRLQWVSMYWSPR